MAYQKKIGTMKGPMNVTRKGVTKSPAGPALGGMGNAPKPTKPAGPKRRGIRSRATSPIRPVKPMVGY